MTTRRGFLQCLSWGAVGVRLGALQTDPLAGLRAQLAAPKLDTQLLAPNLWMVSGDGGNITVLSGPEGKLVFDSGVLPNAPKLIEFLQQTDRRPIKTLVNTHWHFDHTDGNEALHNAGARIIAHENTLKRMSTPQTMEIMHLQFPPSPAGALPTKTFTEHITLNHGQKIEVTPVAPAHTDSDAFAFFPKHNVLVTGDLVFGSGYPLIDFSSGGRIQGMIDASDTLLRVANENTKIVPGHGALQTRAQLVSFREMLATIRDRVAKSKAEGKTLEETQALKPTADFDSVRGPGFMTPDLFVMLIYRTL